MNLDEIELEVLSDHELSEMNLKEKKELWNKLQDKNYHLEKGFWGVTNDIHLKILKETIIDILSTSFSKEKDPENNSVLLYGID